MADKGKGTGKGYHSLLVSLIKRLLRQNPLLTRDQLNEALRTARAQSGGYARAEQRSGGASLADDAEDDSFEELIAEVRDALQATFGPDAQSVATYPAFVIYYRGAPTYSDPDDNDSSEAVSPADDAWEEATEGQPDGDNDADDQAVFYRVTYDRDSDGVIRFGAQTAVEKNTSFVPAGQDDSAPDCYEAEIDELEESLGRQYGDRCEIVASYPDRVVYCLCDASGERTYYEQPYSEDEGTEELTFGDRTEVVMSITWDEIAAEAGGTALAYTKAGASGSVSGGKRTLPANVQKLPANLQKKWVDVFNSAMQHCGGGKGGKKCEQAAFRMANGVIKKSVAAEAGEWGDSAGSVEPGTDRTAPVYALDNNGQVHALPPRLAGVDWNNRGFAPVMLRLSDDGGRDALPAWQQLHKIGRWVVPHASGRRIEMTRSIGNKIISNFVRNVVRRPIPLDYRHFTDQGGEALGQLKEIRWGSEGQGLSGSSEPDGRGPILYGRFEYNSLGVHKLSDRQFSCISPQYFLNYTDDETGNSYGPTIVAVAATNNPYLRIRTIQGEPVPEPVTVLDDGLIFPTGTGGNDMADEAIRLEMERMAARLEQTERALALERSQRHVATVESYLNAAIHDGLSPALARIAKPILLHSGPDADAVISLSDDPAERTHNLHNAVRELIDAIPRVQVGVTLTHQDDARPRDTTSDGARSLQLDDQVVNDWVQGLKRLAGFNDDGSNIDAVLQSTERSDSRAAVSV